MKKKTSKKNQIVNLSQVNYGQQVNHSQVNKSQLRESEHKVIENKKEEEGSEASILVMLLVTLLGRSFIASW